MPLQEPNYGSQSPSTRLENNHDLSTIQYLQQNYPLPHYMLDSTGSSIYHPESFRKRTYEDAKREKKRLEDCIKYVQERVIPRLEMELAQVANDVLEHQLVLAPMSSLPTEILLCIMSFFLGPDNQNDLVNLSNSVWLLTQVCQRWRNIALGTPSFWSNVIIDLRDRERSLELEHQTVPQVLSTFIRRSNALPLTISFKCNSGVTSLATRIMVILLQCRDTWHNVVLDVTPALIPSSRSPLFQQADHSSSPLQSLSLNMSFLTILGSRVRLFEKTPHLKSVTLFGASALRNREGFVETFLPNMPTGDGYAPLRAAGDLIVGVAPVAFHTHRGPTAYFFPLARDISRKLLLPWKQLSNLDLEFAAFGDFLPVLSQTSNVVDCCLRSYSYTTSAPEYTVISLHKLQSLKLFGTAVFCMHFLSAESLTSLIVEDTTQLIECGQHMIPPFIERSGCHSKLRDLTFQLTPGTYHGLDLIKTTPYLESLHLCVAATTELSSQFGTEALLAALTYPSGPVGHESEYQLRKLTSLSLSVYDEELHSFPCDSLVEMVRSRRNVPVDMDEGNDGEKCVPLEEFRLEVGGHKNSWVNVYAELKEVEGLRFVFSVRGTDVFYQS